MRVFGSEEKLPVTVLGDLLDDTKIPEIAVHHMLLQDAQMQKAQKIREVAQIALVKLDNSEKWRKCLVHNYRSAPLPFQTRRMYFLLAQRPHLW